MAKYDLNVTSLGDLLEDPEVVEIMGPGWSPGPEWRAQIDEFLAGPQ